MRVAFGFAMLLLGLLPRHPQVAGVFQPGAGDVEQRDHALGAEHGQQHQAEQMQDFRAQLAGWARTGGGQQRAQAAGADPAGIADNDDFQQRFGSLGQGGGAENPPEPAHRADAAEVRGEGLGVHVHAGLQQHGRPTRHQDGQRERGEHGQRDKGRRSGAGQGAHAVCVFQERHQAADQGARHAGSADRQHHHPGREHGDGGNFP